MFWKKVCLTTPSMYIFSDIIIDCWFLTAVWRVNCCFVLPEPHIPDRAILKIPNNAFSSLRSFLFEVNQMSDLEQGVELGCRYWFFSFFPADVTSTSSRQQSSNTQQFFFLATNQPAQAKPLVQPPPQLQSGPVDASTSTTDSLHEAKLNAPAPVVVTTKRNCPHKSKHKKRSIEK